MKMVVELEMEEIVVDALKEDYKRTLRNMKELQDLAREKGIKFFELEDYVSDRELLSALDKLLSYYMISDDFYDFKREARAEEEKNVG